MYTQETIRIAATLAKSPDARDQVIRMLQGFAEFDQYSNHRFDKTQALAAFLHDLTLDSPEEIVPPADGMPGERPNSGPAYQLGYRDGITARRANSGRCPMARMEYLAGYADGSTDRDLCRNWNQEYPFGSTFDIQTREPWQWEDHL